MSDYPVMHWDADAGQWVQPVETQRHGDPGANGPGLALAQSGEGDDSDYDYYYDAPSSTSGAPVPSPGSLRCRARAVGPLPAREAAAGVRSAGSRRFSPSLIVRPWHHRPGRGSVCPGKETP